MANGADQNPFAMVPLWVYQAPGVTPTILSMYVALAMYGWDAGKSTAALIEATGIRKSAVYAGIQVLIGVGALVKQDNGRLFVPKVKGERPDSTVTEKGRSRRVPKAPVSTTTEDSATVENPPADSASMETGSVSVENPSATVERASLIDKNRLSISDSPFERFWSAYPLHLDRKIAESAWTKALRKPNLDPEVLIAAASAYAADPNREDGFTKHATTWLNGECWTNGPLPPRLPTNGNGVAHPQSAAVNANGIARSVGDRNMQVLDEWRRMKEAQRQ